MKNARLLHYSHCVSDIERSRLFYADVLGFEVVLEVDFDDVARAAVFLASDDAKWISGAVLRVDGGMVVQ